MRLDLDLIACLIVSVTAGWIALIFASLAYLAMAVITGECGPHWRVARVMLAIYGVALLVECTGVGL